MRKPLERHSAIYLDIGQSGARVQDVDGRRHLFPDRMFPGAEAAQVVRSALFRLPAQASRGILISLSGFRGRVPDITPFAEACASFNSCDQVAVCDDGLAWNFGALSVEPGVVIAVGGGIVAVAKKNNKFVHLDGNGFEFGDSGGAFWLGRQGIRTALRSHEGREVGTSLIAAAKNLVGDLDQLAHKPISSADYHGACIEFAQRVIEAADSGDSIAIEIVTLGSKRIASTTLAAAKQCDLLGSEVLVALAGGLMTSALYSGLVRENILQEFPKAVFIEPKGDAINGLEHMFSSEKRESSELVTWWKK